MEAATAPVMNWDAQNLSEAWKKFKQHAGFIGPLNGKTEQEKIAYLLIWVGEKGRDIYNTWELSSDDAKKLETYYNGYGTYVKPRTNTVFARYQFHHRIQEAGEPFDKFATDLKLFMKECEYDKPDEMVRDRIVFGVQSRPIREKLLQKGSNLTLKTSIDIAHSHEASQQQLHTITPHAEASVNAVTRSKLITDCYYCGRDHPRNKCPAWGSECTKCHKRNHWAAQCEVATQYIQKKAKKHKSYASSQDKPHSGRKGRSRRIHKVKRETDTDTVSEEELTIKAVTNVRKIGEQLQTDLKVDGIKNKLRVQIDTGAETNILPMRCLELMHPGMHVSERTSPSPFSVLRAYDGSIIKHHGTISLRCQVSGPQTTWNNINFFVCDTQGPAILGLTDSKALDLVSVNPLVQHVTVSVVQKANEKQFKDFDDLVTQFPDRFEGQGKIPNKGKLQLKENSRPVVNAPRRCPVHVRKDIQAEIDEMERKGIIEKIPAGQPTEWLSNLVCARKSNSKMRVCLDLRSLNANLKHTYHRSPTVEEITYKMTSATVFSKLDAKDGYWSIVLDESSSLLTAFSSPSSNQRYKFNRMPFGINVSPDLFQEAMDAITRGLDGVISIADDICVFGVDEKQHDENLNNLMLRAKAHGLVYSIKTNASSRSQRSPSLVQFTASRE